MEGGRMISFRNSISEKLADGPTLFRLNRLARFFASPSKIKDGKTGRPLRLVYSAALKSDFRTAKEEVLRPSRALALTTDSYMNAESWSFDQTREELEFRFAQRDPQRCHAVFLFGVYETFDDVLWAWADDRFERKAKTRLSPLRSYGKCRSYSLLTTPQFFGIKKDLLWHLGALCAWKLRLPYVLFVRVDDSYAYFVAASLPEPKVAA